MISKILIIQTFPNGPKSKSLLDESKEISLASSKQWDSAEKHGKIVQNASDQLDFQKQAVNALKNTLNNTGVRDNQVNVKLQSLQNDSEKRKYFIKLFMINIYIN